MASIRQQLDCIISEVLDFNRIPGDNVSAWYERQVCLDNIQAALQEIQKVCNAKHDSFRGLSLEDIDKENSVYDDLVDKINYNE